MGKESRNEALWYKIDGLEHARKYFIIRTSYEKKSKKNQENAYKIFYLLTID